MNWSCNSDCPFHFDFKSQSNYVYICSILTLIYMKNRTRSSGVEHSHYTTTGLPGYGGTRYRAQDCGLRESGDALAWCYVRDARSNRAVSNFFVDFIHFKGLYLAIAPRSQPRTAGDGAEAAHSELNANQSVSQPVPTLALRQFKAT